MNYRFDSILQDFSRKHFDFDYQFCFFSASKFFDLFPLKCKVSKFSKVLVVDNKF